MNSISGVENAKDGENNEEEEEVKTPVKTHKGDSTATNTPASKSSNEPIKARNRRSSINSRDADVSVRVT